MKLYREKIRKEITKERIKKNKVKKKEKKKKKKKKKKVKTPGLQVFNSPCFSGEKVQFSSYSFLIHGHRFLVDRIRAIFKLIFK